jgi:hypothetical protein
LEVFGLDEMKTCDRVHEEELTAKFAKHTKDFKDHDTSVPYISADTPKFEAFQAELPIKN